MYWSRCISTRTAKWVMNSPDFSCILVTLPFGRCGTSLFRLATLHLRWGSQYSTRRDYTVPMGLYKRGSNTRSFGEVDEPRSTWEAVEDIPDCNLRTSFFFKERVMMGFESQLCMFTHEEVKRETINTKMESRVI